MFDKLKSYLFPQQKWLTKKIPKTWEDKPELIRNILFEILVNYVEEEEGLQDQWDWEKEICAGHVSDKYVADIKKHDGELRAAYQYVKNGRLLIEEYLDFILEKDDIKKYAEVEDYLQKRDIEIMTIIVKHHGKMWT